MIHRYEGGYGWNKADPGGPTNYGITCYDYAEYRGRKMDSMSNWAPLVKAMTLAEAEAIYKKKYARALKFDDLPPGIDCCMMDYGVNSGVARPIRVARALCDTPGSDALDIQLFDAIKKMDAEQFINRMCDERLTFMKRLRTWPTFGRGWAARVADLRSYSDHLAHNSSPATAPPVAPAVVPPPKATNAKKSSTTVSTGGAITAGAGAHLAGAPIWISLSVVVVAIAAGAIYEIWQQDKVSTANALVILPKAA